MARVRVAARAAVALAVALSLLGLVRPGSGTANAATTRGSEDDIAATYYQALLLNTPFVETTWEPANGTYRMADFFFVSVLGNAVLTTHGSYDEAVAGVSRATLREHTISTIQRAAANNVNVNPAGTWGRRVHWDATMESYFVLAAKLLWADLDDTTRANVDAIIRGTANYMVSLGTGTDPMSPGWTTNGLTGTFVGDTKMEEMGARTGALGLALAWLPGDANTGAWREWLARWTTNMSGLPAADRANPTPVNGTPIAEGNQAQNIYDTFLVENHGSWAPIYQQSIGAYPGRNAAQFVTAGSGAPAEATTVPNADPLWFTMGQLGTNAGVPHDLTVADRHHLYGRNVIPLTNGALIERDPYVARAEQMLADHLLPYIRFAPAGRLTKFSGEPKYEPEARAEIAMAYLLHYYRDRLGGGVKPVSEAGYFAKYASAVDYGAVPSIVAQQSTRALAAAVTKAGFVKYAYLPQHDDWLFDLAGTNPALLPSVALTPSGKQSHTYHRLRDGIDATATVVRTATGAAGFTTLPGGTVVYASSGIGAGEGVLGLHNRLMPGVPGLDGNRRFDWAGGSATLDEPTPGLGDGGVDEVRFPATTARHVRIFATDAATRFGFSLWELEAYAGSGGNLAAGRPATASSFDAGNLAAGGPFPAELATDGRADTRWAVAPAERPNPGWLAVDLGSPQTIDRVVLRWESAFASRYRIEVSDDGATWRRVIAVPASAPVTGDWLNVDGRAGFVVRGGSNPISVSSNRIVLSDGPAAGSAGMVIEGYPAESANATARHAAAGTPSQLPAGVQASIVGGHLSVFNLGAAAVTDGTMTLPQPGQDTIAYQGSQTVSGAHRSQFTVSVPAADAQVLPARFAVSSPSGEALPTGLVITADDSQTLRLRPPAGGHPAPVRVRSLATGETRTVSTAPGTDTTVRFTQGLRTPTDDLARGRTTFPTSPLPAGMSAPAPAVDGDPATSWTPGGAGRMVVDLGAVRQLGGASLSWTAGAPQARIEVSSNGLTYTTVATAPAGGGPNQLVPLAGTARYVAVVVPGWRPGQPALADFAVRP